LPKLATNEISASETQLSQHDCSSVVTLFLSPLMAVAVDPSRPQIWYSSPRRAINQTQAIFDRFQDSSSALLSAAVNFSPII
jgi:hypothetical protein